FAGVMAVVLGSVGLFLRLTLARELDAGIDQGLRARSADVAALVLLRPEALSPHRHSPLTERGERFAHVLDARGRILDTTPLVRRAPLLDRRQLARALPARRRQPSRGLVFRRRSAGTRNHRPHARRD